MNDNIEVVNLEDKAKIVRQAHRNERKNFAEKRQRTSNNRRGGNRQEIGLARRQDLNDRRRGGNSNQSQQQTQRTTRNQRNQKGSLLRPTGQRVRQRQQQNQQVRQQIIEQPTMISLEPQPNVLFKGLGDFMTDQKLREICQAYGALDMCKLDRDSFGQVKGIGLVRFERADDARRIVKDLNGARIVEGQENSSSGGQVSVKYVEPGENWQRFQVPFGVLPVRQRAPFKQYSKRFMYKGSNAVEEIEYKKQ